MKKNTFQVGASWETLDKDDISQALQKHADVMLLREAQGVKYMRFGPFTGTPVNGTLTIGETSNPIGPREGYIWSIRRMGISGLTTGSSPDAVNVYRNRHTAGIPIWQLNGNNFAYTFGKMEMLLFGGEHLLISGTVTATGQCTFDGDVLEVPAVQVFKLL